MKNKKNLMFDFVSDERPNPLGGSCYDCLFCYIHGVKGMKIRFKHIRDKYSGEFRLYENVFEKKLKDVNKIHFFCDCIDWLHEDNPIENIYRIIEWIEIYPNIKFLSLTKNPERYIEIIEEIPKNMIIGITLESHINYPKYSKSPFQNYRISDIYNLNNELIYYNLPNEIFICVEPILKFNFHKFFNILENINPKFGIALGYDNHKNKLDEPSLKETMQLRSRLLLSGIKVYDKTYRKAWWE